MFDPLPSRAPSQPDSASITTPRLRHRPDPPPRRLPCTTQTTLAAWTLTAGGAVHDHTAAARRRQGSPAASARRGARDHMQSNQRGDCWHHARHTLSTPRNSLLSGSRTPEQGVFSSAMRTCLVIQESTQMSIPPFPFLAQALYRGENQEPL